MSHPHPTDDANLSDEALLARLDRVLDQADSPAPVDLDALHRGGAR